MSDDTTSDPLDDRTLVASAYLDGDVTPAQRARVEADPELLADVERLRAVRAAMLDASTLGPTDASVRDAAIRVALETWDAAGLGAPAGRLAPSEVTAPRLLRFERRRAAARWLAAAAAAVAVVGLGVVLTQLGGGGADDDAASITPAADTGAPAGTTPGPGSDVAGQAPAVAEATGEEAERDEAPAAADTAAGEDTVGAEHPPAAEAPAATLAASEHAGPAAQLESPEELALFAASAMQAGADSESRDMLGSSCSTEEVAGIEEYVATASYRGRPVMIGVDDSMAFAVDADSCEIVAEAPLP